ncbi:MAG: sulfatase-modifying factor [Cytophaga sp.]|nr:sulfatase-modifying factor [Cytophaga sp.]
MTKSILVTSLLVSSLLCLSQNLKTYDQMIDGTSVSFKMVAIPAGKFQIGNKSSNAAADETPTKEITLSPFWMCDHEVTFEEWDLYFKDVTLPQSKIIDGVTRATPQYIDLTWGMGRDARQPTNSMSQQAAMMYCKWLYSKTGFFYRLPTEAEWEYACKANTTVENNPVTLKDAAYFKDNSDSKFHKVKQKTPNAFGIYDMLGNVSEWTIDQYDPAYYQTINTKDPITTPGFKYPRTTRGGSFQDDASQLYCANRTPSDAKWNQRDPQIPKSRWWLTDGMFVGIRVVRPAKQPSVEEIEKFYALYLK